MQPFSKEQYSAGLDSKIRKEWDFYWSGKEKPGNYLYDNIASFYRRFIISKILTHFIKKYFIKGEKVLHAGCGSGQVDEFIIDYINITALDISSKALKIYELTHPLKFNTVLGNIFKLPFPNESFEGIYNLGVMEHFTEEEIHQILLEFKRVLKPNCKIVIFWPPTFGLTVNFLDATHFILNRVFKKNIQLHPEEITRVTSKIQVKEIVEKAGFSLIEYYWGIRDLFTQTVIVAQKDV